MHGQAGEHRHRRTLPPLPHGARDYAEIAQEELEGIVRTTGFFRNKARNLRLMAAELVASHGGEVPREMENLRALPGVGRKTANVVLGNAFGRNEGVVVDTHVGRLSLRLGLTKHADPEKVEADLMKLIPREHWTMFSHWLIFHGRRRCMARSPGLRGLRTARHLPDRPQGHRRPGAQSTREGQAALRQAAAA